MRVVALISSVVVLGLCLTACADQSSQAGGTAPSSSSPSRIASSEEWAQEGQRLLAVKAKTADDPGVLNGGPWAYESQPVDLVGDGVYTLVFNVDASFSLAPPTAIGFDFPPDTGFQVSGSAPYTLTRNADGTQTLTTPIVVSGDAAPYLGFRAWIA